MADQLSPHDRDDLIRRLRQFHANTPVWAPEDRRVLFDAAEVLAASAAREAALTEWVIHLMERVAELQMANNLMSSANPPTQQEPAR